MKTSLLKCLVLISSLLCAISASAFSLSSATLFSADQKIEIEKIVHHYLIGHPDILIEMSKALRDKQIKSVTGAATKAAKENAAELFRSPQTPIVGNPDAKITVVEFFDYQCGHCREMLPILDTIIRNNPDVRIAFKIFPIFGPQSILAAKMALAAHEQGRFVDMHHAIMSSKVALTDKNLMKMAKKLNFNTTKMQKAIKDTAINDALKKNHQLGKELKLLGTPEFIVARTDTNATSTTPIVIIPGAASVAKLQKAIDQASK